MSGILVKNVLFPLVDFVEGNHTLRELALLEKSQWFSRNEILEIQWSRFKNLIIHAYKNTKYYKKLFESYGIHPNDIKEPHDIEKIPILTKDIIRNNLNELIAQNISSKYLYKNSTGGSTGKPLQFCQDINRIKMRKALQYRYDRWTGWEIGDKIGLLWGASQDLNNYEKIKMKIMNKFIYRNVILDAFNIDNKIMELYIKKINHEKPTLLLGYASVLYILAKYIKDNDLSIAKPNGIISTAEMLYNHQKEYIEQVFGCKILNRYGCREVGLIACECEVQEGLHINAENILLETIKTNNDTNDYKSIIVTDLLNYGMPFIRYKTEDLGLSAENRACSCGRGLPLIDDLYGRQTDLLTSPDGKMVSGPSLTLLVKDLKGANKIQFIQINKNEIQVNWEKNEHFSEEEVLKLKTRIRKYLGGLVKYNFKMYELGDFPKYEKFRFTISKINQE